jgi:hypothetical protein
MAAVADDVVKNAKGAFVAAAAPRPSSVYTPDVFSALLLPFLSLVRVPVLMVGAGGIGCELLKTLVLSGFEDIEMARHAAWFTRRKRAVPGFAVDGPVC